ncbi:MAG: MFS transporter [Ktedonobacterales bacterium]
MATKPHSLWRHPAFMTLLTGQTISLIGSEVSELALPLTAVLVLNANPAQMGILRALEYAPAALFGLFAGVWIDRIRRRPVLILTDLGRGLLLGSVPLALFLGVRQIGYLYVVAFFVGLFSIFFAVAYQAYLPSLVQRESLVEANGRLEASRSVAGIVGPGLSGTLVQVLTAPAAILVDAVSFFISALFMLFIRVPEPSMTWRRSSVWRDIGDGLRLTLGHPLLRITLITSSIFNLFAGILNSQYVLYATRDLHILPLQLGAIGVASSMCGLLMAVLAGRLGTRFGIGRMIVVATFLIGAGWLVLPLVHGTPQLATLLIVAGTSCGAMGDALYNVNAVTLRQLRTPSALQGRVSASTRAIIWGLQPVGALAGGTLGITIGLRYTLLITAAGFLVGFLFAFLSPLRSLHSVSPIDEPVDVVAETAV